jgi:hypothetical protein
MNVYIYQENEGFLWTETDPVLPFTFLGMGSLFYSQEAELYADPPTSPSRRKVLPIIMVDPTGPVIIKEKKAP